MNKRRLNYLLLTTLTLLHSFVAFSQQVIGPNEFSFRPEDGFEIKKPFFYSVEKAGTKFWVLLDAPGASLYQLPAYIGYMTSHMTDIIYDVAEEVNRPPQIKKNDSRWLDFFGNNNFLNHTLLDDISDLSTDNTLGMGNLVTHEAIVAREEVSYTDNGPGNTSFFEYRSSLLKNYVLSYYQGDGESVTRNAKLMGDHLLGESSYSNYVSSSVTSLFEKLNQFIHPSRSDQNILIVISADEWFHAKSGLATILSSRDYTVTHISTLESAKLEILDLNPSFDPCDQSIEQYSQEYRIPVINDLNCTYGPSN